MKNLTASDTAASGLDTLDSKALVDQLTRPETLAAAWRELFRRYNTRLLKRVHYQFFGQMEAAECEDLLSATWIKVIENASTFRGASTVYTWILKIALNTGFDEIKSAKRSWRVVLNASDSDGEDAYTGDFLEAMGQLAEPDAPPLTDVQLDSFDRQWRAFAAAHPLWAQAIYLRDACGYGVKELDVELGDGKERAQTWSNRLDRWRNAAATFLAKCR